MRGHRGGAWVPAMALCGVLAGAALGLLGCGGASTGGGSGSTAAPAYVVPTMTPSSSPTVWPVRDPGIIYQDGFYYVLSTDPGVSSQAGYLPIYRSADRVNWTRVGQVFNTVPAFVSAYFSPGTLNALWAPDVSYFNGLYHVYYAASVFGTNRSLIGLATSPTMDPSDPRFAWTSRGMVLSSGMADTFNALDPSIMLDTDASGKLTHVWLQYGSYWGGIFQREIDPTTGLLPAGSTTVTNLATRPGVSGDPVEGSNLVKKNGYYYLFVSFDSCCSVNPADSNYKIAVGRSTSPQGPFLDRDGTSMLNGGGTVLLEGNGAVWNAPGGSTVLIGAPGGDAIAYHALNLAQNGLAYLFVNSLSWSGDNWPVINQ